MSSETQAQRFVETLATLGGSAGNGRLRAELSWQESTYDRIKRELIFWVPKEARWPHLQAHAKQPGIGKTIDDAMVAIERDNPRLKGVLPKDYARPAFESRYVRQLRLNSAHWPLP